MACPLPGRDCRPLRTPPDPGRCWQVGLRSAL